MPLLVAAATRHFNIDVLAFGALLVAGALASGIANRSLLSLTALFVLAGFALGDGGLRVVHFDAGSAFTGELATIALIVILLRDGLEVEREMLQAHWHLPLRKLVLAMPLTAAIVAGTVRLLTDFSWTECLLLGVLLSPTDPVLSSSVVTNPRVPRIVRHSLNLESGLNDGLALPAVVALAAAAGSGAAHFVWWRFVAQDLGFGLLTGLLVGVLAGRLMPRARGDHPPPDVPSHQISLYALGAGFASYGIAVLALHGNGLIAVYVAAITLAIRRPDARVHFERQAENLVEIVKLGIFVVFGSLLTLHGLLHDGWAAVGIVVATLLVARPVAVFAALAGTATDTATKAFMGWFGPKGVATMTFSLLVLADQVPNARRIFDIAALVVFCSIIAHGVTDTAGSDWIAQRSERAPEGTTGPAEELAAG